MFYSKNRYIPFVFLFFIALIFQYEGVVFGNIAVHSDMVQHALAMVDLQSRIIDGAAGGLWTSMVYGGHPIYAEGQMGYYNPINYILAASFDPIYAKNINHFVCKVLLLWGMYCYIRNYDIGRLVSVFSALSVGFSTLFIAYQNNITLDATVVWVPWAMLFFSMYIKKLDAIYAALLAVSIALMVLSGYPHFVHGLILYFITFLIPSIFIWLRDKEYSLLARLTKVIFIAGVVSVLLSAIQWLPLVELAKNSHRSDGVESAFVISVEATLRGIIYDTTEDFSMYGLGSFLVFFLSILSLLKINRHVVGHFLAVIFLLILSAGDATEFYFFLKKTGIIPGLGLFRITFPYLTCVVIGLSVLSSFGLKNIVDSDFSYSTKITSFIFAIIFFLVFIYWTYIPVNSYWQVLFFSSFISFSFIVLFLRKKDFIAPLALIFLLVEMFTLRFNNVNYYPVSVLNRDSPIIKEISSDEGYARYKVYDNLFYGNYIFVPSDNEKLGDYVGRLIAGLLPSYNMHSSISSINGALALPLARRVFLDDILKNEVAGESKNTYGNRFIDVLSIKYLSLDVKEHDNVGYRLRVSDEDYGVDILENIFVQPKFQLYNIVEQVSNYEDVADFKDLGDRLVIDSRDDLELISTNSIDYRLVVIEESDEFYRFTVSSDKGIWLFIADANYPGWKATIDDENVDVLSAQILGKAIYVLPGRHSIKLYFKSDSFLFGTLLSISGLLLVIIFMLTKAGGKLSFF